MSILDHTWADETAQAGHVEYQFFLESIELDEKAIVSSWARIAELRGYLCTAMSSSFLWFVISTLVELSGSERSMGDGRPRCVKRVEMALAYPTKVAARSPSLLV